MSPHDVETIVAAYADGRDLPLTRGHGLPCLWRDLGYHRGLEMGVEQGQYSVTLLEAMPDLHLTLVDAWLAYPGYREHVSQDKLEAFYHATVARLAPYRDRVTIVRGLSPAVAAEVPDGSLDFVYLDGNHRYAAVRADLAAWVPKVRPGGIVAGHDYGRRSVGEVAEAVQEWTEEHGITAWWVTSVERSPSWLWVQHG